MSHSISSKTGKGSAVTSSSSTILSTHLSTQVPQHDETASAHDLVQNVRHRTSSNGVHTYQGKLDVAATEEVARTAEQNGFQSQANSMHDGPSSAHAEIPLQSIAALQQTVVTQKGSAHSQEEAVDKSWGHTQLEESLEGAKTRTKRENLEERRSVKESEQMTPATQKMVAPPQAAVQFFFAGSCMLYEIQEEGLMLFLSDGKCWRLRLCMYGFQFATAPKVSCREEEVPLQAATECLFILSLGLMLSSDFSMICDRNHII